VILAGRALMQAATVEQTQHLTSRGTAGRTRYRSAALWCAGGFCAGALFWYAVGFWRFVSEVVLDSGPQLTPAMAASARPSGATLPTVYLIDPANCTALVLDRKTNSTEMRPCPQQGLALRLEPESARENLAAAGGSASYPAN
jgi:hypothetical protein